MQVEYTFGRMKRVLTYDRPDHWIYNSLFKIIAVLFNVNQRFVTLQPLLYEDSEYPDVAVMPVRRLASFTQMADEFLNVPE